MMEAMVAAPEASAPSPAPEAAYAQLAARLVATGLVSDPWIDGLPRFDATPMTLARTAHARLVACAEAVAAVHDELSRVVAAEPALLESFFGMTEAQRTMWALSAPAWHGLARADVFLTDEGPRCCELNCDTPSGLAEAIALGEVLGIAADPSVDPNRLLERRFVGLVAANAARVVGSHALPTVAIIYPTELTEDLGLIALYRRWLESRGVRVVLGSPFNLRLDAAGYVTVFGVRCDVIVRHYKTDWWGERRPIWSDESPLPDDQPLVEPLRAIAGATLAGRVAIVNPFGAVLPQNKRSMAFLWEARERFSTDAQRAIAQFIPFTARLERCDRDQLANAREQWVLKSDYGCEGEEVIVGAEVSDELWRASLDRALPRRWVAQGRFVPHAETDGTAVNYGVYVIAGRGAGLYARRSRTATDRHAISAAVRLGPEGDR